MKVIDARGQQCPAPLIATRRALRDTGPGEVFKVLLGSKNALNNICMFLKDNKINFKIEDNRDSWTLIIEKQ